MDFIKKNDFIVNHKKDRHFDRDLELFKEKCPNSKLNAELPRLNSFNRAKIHGLLLLDLLDKVSPEEILENRQKTVEAIQDVDHEETPTIDTVEGVKAIVAADMDIEHLQEEVFTFLVGKTAEEIKTLVALSKGSIQLIKTSEDGEQTGTGIDPVPDPEKETIEPISTGSDANTSGIDGKNQSGGTEGSGDKPNGADPEPAPHPEPVKKPETSKTATVDAKTVLKKTGVTRPPVKKKGTKKKSSRK